MENSLSAVVLALLNQRKMSQNELAIAIDTSRSNLSERLKNGSMKSSMIKRISEVLDADILRMIRLYDSGVKLEDVLNADFSNQNTEDVVIELTPEEVKQVMINQKKSQEEIQEQFNQLVSQIKTWIQHDQEKMRQQQEIINMLMEERAEYKTKNKK